MATSRVVNGDDLHAAVRNAKLLSKNTKKQLFGVLLVKPNVGVDGVEDYLVYQFCTTLVYHFNSVTQKPPPPRAVHRRASGCSSWIKKEGDYRGCLYTQVNFALVCTCSLPRQCFSQFSCLYCPNLPTRASQIRPPILLLHRCAHTTDRKG